MKKRAALGAMFIAAAICCRVFLFDDSSSMGTAVFARLAEAFEAEEMPLPDLTSSLEAAAGAGRLPDFAADNDLNSLGQGIMAVAIGP